MSTGNRSHSLNYRRGRSQKARSVQHVRLSQFRGVLFLAAVAGGVWLLGAPHLRWSYDYRASSHDPWSERYYTRCDYIGLYGVFRYVPADGKCLWFRFYKPNSGAKIGVLSARPRLYLMAFERAENSIVVDVRVGGEPEIVPSLDLKIVGSGRLALPKLRNSFEAFQISAQSVGVDEIQHT